MQCLNYVQYGLTCQRQNKQNLHSLEQFVGTPKSDLNHPLGSGRLGLNMVRNCGSNNWWRYIRKGCWIRPELHKLGLLFYTWGLLLYLSFVIILVSNCNDKSVAGTSHFVVVVVGIFLF